MSRAPQALDTLVISGLILDFKKKKKKKMLQYFLAILTVKADTGFEPEKDLDSKSRSTENGV